MVFKCASDTIFLDDFKSVLDVIVGNALKKAGGAVTSGRRRSDAAAAYPRKKEDRLEPIEGLSSKSSAANGSSSDDRELYDLHPTTTCTVGQQTPNGRPVWKQTLFPKRDPTVAPKLKIRRDITISTSHHGADGVRGNSVESFNSKERFLVKPERTHARGDGGRSGSQPKVEVTDMIDSTPP